MSKKKLLFILSMIITIIISVAAGQDGSVFSFMKNYVVQADHVVSGAVFVVGGDLTIEKNATVLGDAVVVFGNLKIDGRVNGSIGTVFGNAEVSSTASILGDSGVVYGKMSAAEGVILGKSEILEAPADFKSGDFLPLITTTVIAMAVLMYLFSCMVYLLFPKRTKNISLAIPNKIGRRFLIGFLINISIVPLIIVLIITFVGAVIIPFVAIAYVAVNLLANVAMAMAVGQKISGESKEGARENPYIFLLSGVLVVFVIAIIPILGWFVYLAGCCVSLGATADTRLGQVV